MTFPLNFLYTLDRRKTYAVESQTETLEKSRPVLSTTELVFMLSKILCVSFNVLKCGFRGVLRVNYTFLPVILFD